jgi:hypothetical protein
VRSESDTLVRLALDSSFGSVVQSCSCWNAACCVVVPAILTPLQSLSHAAAG